MEVDRPRRARRRARAAAPRRRQVLLRFSEEEFALACARAELAGLAVGAWMGEVVLEAARGGHRGVGLPDLLRLHADVTFVAGLFDDDGERAGQVADLLGRLDGAIDAVVAAAR